MKLTPLGKVVIAVVLLLLAWKLLMPHLGVDGFGHAITATRITPVDVMVLIAFGFVVLMVVLNRTPPQQPSTGSSARSAPPS